MAALRLLFGSGRCLLRAKKACEPLHIQYSYDDVPCVVNGYLDSFALRVSAVLYGVDGEKLWEWNEEMLAGPDSATRLLSVPDLNEELYSLSLELEGESFSDTNLCRLSKKRDIIDYENTTWYYTPVREYSDFSAIGDLKSVEPEASAEEKGGRVFVRIKNPSDTIAFFVTLRASDGNTTVPSFWSDNCVSLLPGEERVIEGSVMEGSEIVIESYNCNKPAFLGCERESSREHPMMKRCPCHGSAAPEGPVAEGRGQLSWRPRVRERPQHRGRLPHRIIDTKKTMEWHKGTLNV